MSCGNAADEALTFSINGTVAMLITNSPVCSMFRRLSLRPTDVNCTTGGAVLATVKKLYGARLNTPSSASVDTHAIGLGTIVAVRRR